MGCRAIMWGPSQQGCGPSVWKWRHWTIVKQTHELGTCNSFSALVCQGALQPASGTRVAVRRRYRGQQLLGLHMHSSAQLSSAQLSCSIGKDVKPPGLADEKA